MALTDDQKASFTERTETRGYTPAFKYESILSSSSLFPSSQILTTKFFHCQRPHKLVSVVHWKESFIHPDYY